LRFLECFPVISDFSIDIHIRIFLPFFRVLASGPPSAKFTPWPKSVVTQLGVSYGYTMARQTFISLGQIFWCHHAVKHFSTLLTTIRFISSVCSNVGGQVAGSGKSFSTLLATMWFFSSVCSHVRGHVEARCKSFFTNLATI